MSLQPLPLEVSQARRVSDDREKSESQAQARAAAPMGFWKVAFAVCVGMMMAASLGALGYYLAVQAPREAEQARQARFELQDLAATAAAEVRAQQAENKLLAQQVAARERATARGGFRNTTECQYPCSLVPDSQYAACSDLPTLRQRLAYFNSHVPAGKKKLDCEVRPATSGE